jgi:hypothetical protein
MSWKKVGSEVYRLYKFHNQHSHPSSEKLKKLQVINFFEEVPMGTDLKSLRKLVKRQFLCSDSTFYLALRQFEILQITKPFCRFFHTFKVKNISIIPRCTCLLGDLFIKESIVKPFSHLIDG